MKLLALDTSSELASITLYDKGELRSLESRVARQHTQWILPSIQELLAEFQLHCGQLDGIIFGQGPGSFTGIRIACSIAKGLAFAHDLPVYPVSSLRAIAQATVSQTTGDKALLAVLDARMNQVYWACYHQTLSDVEQVSDPKDVLIASDMPLCLTGVGYPLYREQWSSIIRERIVEEVETYPHAAAMLRLVLDKKVLPMDAAHALPVYLRNQVVQGDSCG